MKSRINGSNAASPRHAKLNTVQQKGGTNVVLAKRDRRESTSASDRRASMNQLGLENGVVMPWKKNTSVKNATDSVSVLR